METVKGNRDDKSDFVACDVNDFEYFGAARVVRDEQDYLRARSGLEEGSGLGDLTGLALSGGGIRSASFSLGIMQALAYRGWLEKVDYLSTVSGGGYIGSSLTWLLKTNPDFGVKRQNFPYDSFPMSSQARSDESITPLAQRLNPVNSQYRGRLLRFLRQNACYLNPGRGINLFSLAGVALRGSLAGIAVYGGIMAILLWVFMSCGVFGQVIGCSFVPAWFRQNWLLFTLFWGIAIYACSILVFAFVTIIVSNWLKWGAYSLRRGYEVFLGYLLPVLVGLTILGCLPQARNALINFGKKPGTAPGTFTISGQQAPAGSYVINGVIKLSPPAPKDKQTAPGAANNGSQSRPDFHTAVSEELRSLLTGALALVLAIASALGAFFKTGRPSLKKLPLGPIVAIGISLLIFGQLLFNFSLLNVVMSTAINPLYYSTALIVILILACANINYISLHRFYRDRLMETFLPNVNDLLNRNYASAHKSKAADKAPLHTMGALTDDGKAGPWSGPYHIINTNVVLVSSDNPKFRGRGGDSFILSPAFCGSNATGWRATSNFMGGTMTLASAMAISGAALNPSAGCGGEGITRSPFLSALMGMLNFRLGYWVPNPNPRKALWKMRTPTSIAPGICEVAFRNRLNEKNRFLQLSDGGHFENLGLYELVRRKIRLIIVCDGGADPDFTFSDLANAMEKVRSDFGALIILESESLARLVPHGSKDAAKSRDIACATSPYLIARIIYADGSEGRLIYITTNFFKQLSADLYGYRKEHPAFPDEPTSDQFFDEKQFEAYRELGFQAAWTMMDGKDVTGDAIVRQMMLAGATA